MSEYSMPSYFQTMPVIGKEVAHFSEENAAQIQEVEQEIHEIREAALEAGKSTEALNESGQWTAMQRIEELVDEGTWCPLNSLYNPQDNDNGSVGIVKGLGRINGKWAVIIASDNKKLAGAWVPGQADALLRGSDTAKRLRIPLVYVLNCSGVKLDEQEKVYPNRRGGGTRWACPSSSASTAPTPPAAAITPSAPPSSSRMRTPTWQSAAPASSAA